MFLLFLALGFWSWQFVLGNSNQLREPLGVVDFVFDQEEVLLPFVGGRLGDVADVAPTRIGRFNEQLVVADQCDNLAL